MLKKFLFAISGLVIATGVAHAAPVDAKLAGLNCDGDYCILSFTVADKAQTAICADETYCEKWDDAGAIPQDVLSKTVKLTLIKMHLDDEDKDADVVSEIAL